MRGRRWSGALALVVLSGCGGGAADDAAPVALEAAAVCPGGTLQDGVVVCRELQPAGDALTLPADAGAVRYGALGRGGDRFHTRGGALQLSPEAAEALQEQLDADRQPPGSGAAEDGDVAGRTGPYAQTVYRARVDGRTVTALTPVVRVDEAALMTRVFGGAALEGTIAPFVSVDEGYDLDPVLPVRIELADTATAAVVTGRVVNAVRPVRLSTGACAPALAGPRDPLQEPFTAQVALQRYPSMHSPFDDELLLKWSTDASNMGADLFPTPATLLGLEPLGPTWEAYLHGNPLSGPAVRLSLVEGGGGDC